uniref:Deoxyribonuclease n=1 Tax=Mastomys natalensis cytomegalovirus 1 TaxID=2973541 RepID=A0A9Y1N7L3_9BETA|nr:deoxyribonuclease [Mastomys natalensis cytomegalovirus 1]WEG71184.1 deoxyribonuclease [Mastomys natalensis cytomegalovirus 1]
MCSENALRDPLDNQLYAASEKNDDDEESLVRALRGFSDEPFELFCMYNLLDCREKTRTVPVSAIRIAHLRSVFNKMNECHAGPGIATTFLKVIDDELVRVGSDVGRNAELDRDGAHFDMAYAIFSMPHHVYMRILKAVEKDSRGQSSNPVWHALRLDTISATRFFDVFSTSRLTAGNRRETLVGRGCEAIRFGVQCEPLIRIVLEEFVIKGREMAGSDIGLLLDPSSGILGASLDFCVGVTRDDDELLSIAPNAAIFEIKCRFKYLRSRDDDAVKDFLTCPNIHTFSSFILSHPIPAIEFRQDGDTPSGREALISHDKVFKQNLKRRRSGKAPDFIRSWLDTLINLNSAISSTIIVFDVCVDEDSSRTVYGAVSDSDGKKYLDIVEKARFTAPVFINPRHPYYCQTLLQQYVLSQYYINAHCDPERMSPDELPSVHLVSAILRKRDESEQGYSLKINGRVSDCEEIPLCVVVTPIQVDPLFTRDAVNCVLNTWERDIQKKTGLSLWVQSAVSVYVASCIREPRTP